MKTHAVLSALGRDRIGVAGDLSSALATRRIQIEESRMAALRGRFALMAQVCGEDDDLAALQKDLSGLGAKLGFDLQLGPFECEPERPVERGSQFLIECFSTGPVGMNAVTGLLRMHGVNIENLETEVSEAPWKHAITYRLSGRITVPASCPITELREELRRLEQERDLDIAIKPSPSGEPVPVL